MSNFAVRALTGVTFVLVLLGSIWIHPYALGGLFLLIACVAIIEFYGLVEKDGVEAQKPMGIVGTIILVAGNFAYATGLLPDLRWLILLLPLVFIVFIIELFKTTEKPFTNVAYTLLGLVYVALPFSLVIYLAMFPNQSLEAPYFPELLFGFFFILWANDTGAYLIGSQIGKRKLFERVSPNKSWEGSIGGALTAIGVAIACAQFFHKVSLLDWLALGVIIAVTGSLGDLVESRLKRSLKTKDSGNILPGHGGLLDRFDASLVSIPFVITYLVLTQNLVSVS